MASPQIPIVSTLAAKKYRRLYPASWVGNSLLYTSAIVAALGQFVVGFVEGINGASHVQPSFLNEIYNVQVTDEEVYVGTTGVSPYVQVTVFACLSMAAFLSSFIAAYGVDIRGRRAPLRSASVVILIGVILCGRTEGIAMYIVGRCLCGAAAGFYTVATPIYHLEIATNKLHGVFVSIGYQMLNIGLFTSGWICYGFYFTRNELGWRLPYIIPGVFAIILIFWSYALPESPRWLIRQDLDADAEQVVADLHGNGDVKNPRTQTIFANMTNAIKYEDQIMSPNPGWLDLFSARYSWRTMVATGFHLFAQFNGIVVIGFVTPLALNDAGYATTTSLVLGAMIATIAFLGIFPVQIYGDKYGRTPFLLTGSFSLAITLFIMAGIQLYVDNDITYIIRSEKGIVAFIAIYLFLFSLSWGPVPFLLGVELFPIRIRGKGGAVSSATHWFFTAAMAYIAQGFYNASPGGLYVWLAAMSMISAIFTFSAYRETAHYTLEELSTLYGGAAPGIEHGPTPESQAVAESRLVSVPPAEGAREKQVHVVPHLDSAPKKAPEPPGAHGIEPDTPTTVASHEGAKVEEHKEGTSAG